MKVKQAPSFRQRMHGIHQAAVMLYLRKSQMFKHGFRAYADGMTSRVNYQVHILKLRSNAKGTLWQD